MKDKLLSVFDTGTALGMSDPMNSLYSVLTRVLSGIFPQYYFDAVYKDVKGLEVIDKSLGIYSIPCDTKLNVSMVFKYVLYFSYSSFP